MKTLTETHPNRNFSQASLNKLTGFTKRNGEVKPNTNPNASKLVAKLVNAKRRSRSGVI